MRLKMSAVARCTKPATIALSLFVAMSGCDEEHGADSGSSSDSEGQAPPAAQSCSDDLESNPAWVQLEFEVLQLVNDMRRQGADCGERGRFGPAPALKSDPRLRCAALLHSKDMADRRFFDHGNPDGENPLDRIRKTGYEGRLVGENIAAGQPSASAVMAGWMKSDGHCANIMKQEYTEIGVGYIHASGTKYKHYWTQNFGQSK